MKLRILIDGGGVAEVGECDAPQLFAAVEDWQNTNPRSLKEVARWAAVIEAAEKYLEDEGAIELVNGVEVIL